jgi:hypothetical protein
VSANLFPSKKMTPQQVGLLSAAIPTPFGDGLGLLADVAGYAQDPASLTLRSGLLSLAAMAPGVPARSTQRILYRGTTGAADRIKGGIGEGYLFAADNEKIARLYGDQIERMAVSPSAKILVEGTKEFASVTGRRRGPLLRTLRKGEGLHDASNDAIMKAKAAGYDIVDFSHMPEQGLAILNETAVTRGL